MTHVQQAVDTRLVKALAHPLRQRILIRLNEKVSSPSELAGEFGEKLPNVAYHFRALERLGAIELVRTTPRRGAVEHHYRALTRPFFSDADIATLPPSTRRKLFDDLLALVWQDVARAAAGNGFDDDRTHLSRTTLGLDERGWSELAKLLSGVRDKAFAIQERSAGRMAKRGEEPLSAQLVLMQFRNPPAGAAPDTGA